MRISIILLLLLGFVSYAEDRRKGLSGSAGDVDGRVRSRVYTQAVSGTSEVGQFAFATASGAGMTAACACSTITGARGETATFSRASTATCTKGNETSLIANGDLVTCSSGQPRVMPGGDGTGIRGVSLWESRTNTLLRNSEIENAVWATVGSGIAAPTITANYATAPDGTATADRMQIAAAGAGTASYIYQTACPTGAARAQSLYVRGTSGSGTVLMAGGSAFGSAGGGYVQCPYVSTSWTRCLFRNSNAASANPFLIGTSPLEGTITTGAIDVLVWGTQCETGVDPSPVIATAGTAATRAAEVLSFPWSQAVDTSGSMAATLVSPYPSLGGLGEHAVLAEQVAGSYDRLLLLNTNINYLIGYGINAINGASSLSANVESRAVYWWTPSTGDVLWNTVAGSPASVFPSGDVSTIQLGSYNASSGVLNGVIKKVCADSSSTVCR
jgi:hypothetical protein